MFFTIFFYKFGVKNINFRQNTLKNVENVHIFDNF